jgi:pimeloyl-ACP methyl ester carboxylesterase
VPNRIDFFQSGEWRLNACVHVPDNGPARPRIGVITLAELNKFGPHGLFRQVAEAFTAAGFYALRFENRGTCDSSGDCTLSFEDRLADACAATEFFVTEYKLDQVLFWGMCLGGAIAVHASARLKARFKPAGMILCSLLLDPAYATLPEFNYSPVAFSAYLKKGLTGSPWARLREFASNENYRTDVLKSVAAIARNSRRSNGRLQHMRAQISRVGPVLTEYGGPTLLIFGDTDPYWSTFTKRVHDDHLELSEMKSPPKIVLVADGDHMFRSVSQTSEMIRLCVSWGAALRDGQTLAGSGPELDATCASPAAN